MNSNIGKKRKNLDMSTKLRILEIYDMRVKSSQGKVNKSKFAAEFGLTKTSFASILTARKSLEIAEEAGKVIIGRKRCKVSPYDELNNCVLLWFKQMVAKNIPVDGGLLKQKAGQFALQLSILDFKASNGD